MAAHLLSAQSGAPATSWRVGSFRAVLPVAVALATAALGLYLTTAARTITWAHGGADGAELSVAAAVLGVAHPPGYPLYIMLAHAFTWLPVGEIAFRVGLLSALSAALGVGLASAVSFQLSAISYQNPEPRAVLALSTQHSALGPVLSPQSTVLGTAAAGLVLATSPLYWSQATVAEVYALNATLVLAALALTIAWRPGSDRLLPPLGLLFGLGLGVHLTLLFLAASVCIYVLVSDPGVLRRRAGPAAAGAFLTGLSVYVYLPVRAAAGPPLNWGQPDTLPRFLDHVSGRMYQGYLGGQNLAETLDRVPVLAGLLIQQLTLPGLGLAFLGLATLLSTRPALGRMLLGYMIATVLFTLMYRAKDGEVYLLPVLLVLVPCLGLGIMEAASNPWGRALGLAALMAILAWQIAANLGEMDVSRDRTAITYAQEALGSAPRDAVLVTRRDEETFALWYAQVVDGLRPDVAVVDARLREQGWYRAELERTHPGAIDGVRP